MSLSIALNVVLLCVVGYLSAVVYMAGKMDSWAHKESGFRYLFRAPLIPVAKRLSIIPFAARYTKSILFEEKVLEVEFGKFSDEERHNKQRYYRNGDTVLIYESGSAEVMQGRVPNIVQKIEENDKMNSLFTMNGDPIYIGRNGEVTYIHDDLKEQLSEERQKEIL